LVSISRRPSSRNSVVRGTSAEERLSVRKAESAALMVALKERLDTLISEVSAKSSLGKAVAYALSHWQGLTAFLGDGSCPWTWCSLPAVVIRDLR
jgi:hypothetical protein